MSTLIENAGIDSPPPSPQTGVSTFKRLLWGSEHVRDLRIIFRITLLVGLFLLWYLLWEAKVPDATGAPKPTDWLSSVTNTAKTFGMGAILATVGGVLAWCYQTGSSRLGVVDLFGCEIATICRVTAIAEAADLYVKAYDSPPEKSPEFISGEDYAPVFDHLSKDLEILEARVVAHVTEFYTYMKATRDYLRVLAKTQNPREQQNAEEWRNGVLNVVYMLFLMLESGREAVLRLIEYAPERQQNVITIFLSEVVLFGFLIHKFEERAQHSPNYNAKLQRLRLRQSYYPTAIKQTTAYVKENARKTEGSKEHRDWLKALVLLDELHHRFGDHCGDLYVETGERNAA